jgi:hypothetical protein
MDAKLLFDLGVLPERRVTLTAGIIRYPCDRNGPGEVGAAEGFE